MFAKHGFQDLAEKVKLGKFFTSKWVSPELVHLSVPERLRISFEQLGPTFVKLGQLLAARPDLIPSDFVDEFKKLHDRVACLPFSDMERVLASHFGRDLSDIFSSFDENPIGAASIAQVYSAVLINGENVVVKVQRPNIEGTISEDLSVLYVLAELLHKYVPESRVLNLTGIVDEFSKVLQLETNFIVEANNIRRFVENFKDEPNIKIPHVYSAFTGRRVLVMEALQGVPLSQATSLKKDGIDPESIVRVGLKCYLKMVFSDGLFHGDLHAGNMFVLENNKIGLIDFGVVGRLNRKTQQAIARILVSLASEDYDRLAYEFLDLSVYSGHVDIEQVAREFRDIIAPFYGLTSKDVNVGKLLMEVTSVAARHKLILPVELVMFFKSIMTIEGMGRVLIDDFDFMSYSLEFASEMIQTQYEPVKMAKELGLVGRDLSDLLHILPRHIKHLLRRMNSPNFSLKLDIQQSEEIKRAIGASANILFLGLIIGSLILSASILVVSNKGPFIMGLPALSAIGYGAALILGLAAFINYIKKS